MGLPKGTNMRKIKQTVYTAERYLVAKKNLTTAYRAIATLHIVSNKIRMDLGDLLDSYKYDQDIGLCELEDQFQDDFVTEWAQDALRDIGWALEAQRERMQLPANLTLPPMRLKRVRDASGDD